MFYIKRIFKPEIYQGRNKKKNYFEGWYYKQVSADTKQAIALIPGISLDSKDPHAFVQVISSNGSAPLVTDYFRFLLSDFHYQDEPFQIQIGQNVFSKEHIFINLKNVHLQVTGHLKFGTIEPIHRSLAAPNIMGFFGYFHFMECYHAVISMCHGTLGEMTVNNRTISFVDGRGYIEKDWGRSFPKAYIWVQCNHFTDVNTSLMLSVAHIPFMRSSFKGFICNVRIRGQEYRFATYNRSKIIQEEIGEHTLCVQLIRKGLILEIEAKILDNANLMAPKNGKMVHTIKEGLSGEVKIKLMNQRRIVLYEDHGYSAGVEIVT